MILSPFTLFFDGYRMYLVLNFIIEYNKNGKRSKSVKVRPLSILSKIIPYIPSSSFTNLIYQLFYHLIYRLDKREYHGLFYFDKEFDFCHRISWKISNESFLRMRLVWELAIDERR